MREEIGLGGKFKDVTKFTQYCQRRHNFERRDRLARKDVLEVSQNSHSTASGDTRLREEIGLGGKFKGVTKFTQYSIAS